MHSKDMGMGDWIWDCRLWHGRGSMRWELGFGFGCLIRCDGMRRSTVLTWDAGDGEPLDVFSVSVLLFSPLARWWSTCRPVVDGQYSWKSSLDAMANRPHLSIHDEARHADGPETREACATRLGPLFFRVIRLTPLASHFTCSLLSAATWTLVGTNNRRSHSVAHHTEAIGADRRHEQVQVADCTISHTVRLQGNIYPRTLRWVHR